MKKSTTNYTRVGKNLYSYTRANGKRTFRARKFHKNTWTTATFHTLKDAKDWLNLFTTPTMLKTRKPSRKMTATKTAPRKTTTPRLKINVRTRATR